MIAVASLLAAVLALSPAEVEERTLRHVVTEYERIGRSAPVNDARLDRAARVVAERALASSASAAADPIALSEAVSDADAWDPHPRWLVVRASSAKLALESLKARADLNGEPATHLGISLATRGESAALAVMLTDRKVVLAPFPRTFERAPAVQTLCGELAAGLASPDVYVTQPDGDVDRLRLSRVHGPSFCAGLDFPKTGRYTVEVIGHGNRGPEVASLFYVDVGPRSATARGGLVEPRTMEDARVAILARINALRRAHGVGALRVNETLTHVAQSYSERMAREHYFAHFAPDGSDVRARVSRAGYASKQVGENLGLANGALAAHFGIEHSPGHRKNLLDPAYEEVGIGIAIEEVAGRTQVLVTQVLASPLAISVDPLGDAYRTVADRRASLKLPPLRRSPVLEQLAREHAQRALSLNQPKTTLPGSQIHERVFQALDEVNGASVDLFIAESPAQLPASKSLSDGKNRLVGIGAVKGSSPTFGRDKYWVVVIYASAP